LGWVSSAVNVRSAASIFFEPLGDAATFRPGLDLERLGSGSASLFETATVAADRGIDLE
jgi:hypothetical protein